MSVYGSVLCDHCNTYYNDEFDHTCELDDLFSRIADLEIQQDVYRDQLDIYKHAINAVDDYFEYQNESNKDKVRVHNIMVELINKLQG